MQVHIHEHHGQLGRATRSSIAKGRLHNQLYNFSLVVCRHPLTNRFLLCHEFSNQGFWLPGGAVDGGETFTAAAFRETMEEAGIKVNLKGILAVEYNPCGRLERERNDYLVRMRVIFYAEPTEDYTHRPPKSTPDFESAGACWCSIEQMKEIRLRGQVKR
jgi:8-oxo-dGTP pyrophosphatase MutT (NUDIX family)